MPDAFVCIDPVLARALSGTVTVVSIDDLISSFQARLEGPSAGE